MTVSRPKSVSQLDRRLEDDRRHEVVSEAAPVRAEDDPEPSRLSGIGDSRLKSFPLTRQREQSEELATFADDAADLCVGSATRRTYELARPVHYGVTVGFPI